jgi:hypothetical protein
MISKVKEIPFDETPIIMSLMPIMEDRLSRDLLCSPC